MNKLRYIIVLCVVLGCASGLSAQTFESVYRRNLWNGSSNVAGIRQDTVSRSFAELHGGYEAGEFRDSWQARKSWHAGAVTRSIRHLDRISLAGSFSFDQTEGYGMCGSMFISPGYYPVDVLEFTPGRKTLQTYAFDGGLAYEVNDVWTIGAKADFESANMAKRKDLRHINWKLDLTLSPGVTAHVGDFVLGVSAVFRKTSETINAVQIGTAESSYHAFFDKGLMYGIEQVWTGSGVHLNESGVNRLPVKEFHYGGSAQIQYKGLYADFDYMHAGGSVGEKEYIWFGFKGPQYAADVRYKMVRPASEHYFRLHYSHRVQDMDERVLEKVSGNGVTTVIDHGENRIYSREMIALSPEYEYVAEILELKAVAGLEWENGMTSQVYPYIYTQSLMTMYADTDVLLHLGDFDLGAKLGYASGKVSETERTASKDQQVQTVPFRLKEWYDVRMEYRTAPRMSAGLSLRYNFLNGMYVEGACDWMHGFDLKYLDGANRICTDLRVGYTF